MPLEAQTVYNWDDRLMAEGARSPFPGTLIILGDKLKHLFYILKRMWLYYRVEAQTQGWEDFSRLRWGNLATLPERLAGTHSHFSAAGEANNSYPLLSAQ